MIHTVKGIILEKKPEGSSSPLRQYRGLDKRVFEIRSAETDLLPVLLVPATMGDTCIGMLEDGLVWPEQEKQSKANTHARTALWMRTSNLEYNPMASGTRAEFERIESYTHYFGMAPHTKYHTPQT